MLVLKRKTGATIHIGNEITVTVLEVTGNQVRIGIDAPKEIPVHREEIHNRIKKLKSSQDQILRINSNKYNC